MEFVGSFPSLALLPKDRQPQIAIAGRSNVGKSSLLNRILSNKKLARVSKTPGRTRSLNFFMVGDKFYLVDLPGYGYAKVSKSMRAEWGQLIDDYLTKGKDLIGLVLLLDSRRETTKQDMELLDWLAERKLPVLIALTKTDKLSKSAVTLKVKKTEEKLGAPAIPFSVVTGQGAKELLMAVSSLVEEHRTQVRTGGYE